jgi:AsmA protein
LRDKLGYKVNSIACPVWKVIMRAPKIAGAAIAAIAVVVVLLSIIGIPSGLLTSAIQDRIERETGYRLTISGAAKIGVWPTFNVSLNDIALQDPKHSDRRLTAERIQADVTLSSLWSGHPQVTELAIVRPVLSVPLLRERLRETSPSPEPAPAAAAGDEASAPAIYHVTVSDGTVVFSNLHDRVEDHIDGINADVGIGNDRRIAVTGSARAGEHPLKFQIKATAPAPPLERQNIPAEFSLDVPGVLQAPLSGKAEARLNGAVVMINGLTGTLGDAAFNGWASIDLASKPLVKLDLDFRRLDVAAPANRAASSAQPSSQPGETASPSSQPASQPWSDASIDLMGLNYVDVQARISAAELDIGNARLAPAAIDANLAHGVLRLGVSNLGAYDGQASGELDIDASSGDPAYMLRTDLAGVHALPLLRDVADFDKLDGKLQAKIALRSAGTSQRAIMSNLDGSVFAIFQDGAIRGVNVARMIRSLTSSPLSGWQEAREETTDLTQLSMSFRVDKGQATSSDLNLVGPLVRVTGAGTVDLGARSLAFRVEPKLVMTTEGQGRTTDPVGLGIPVVIDGPWASPRIYPDVAGILDNPDAAYTKLKEMGKGLFGAGLGASGDSGSDGSGGKDSGSTDQLGGRLGETLGNLLQQGLSRGRGTPAPAAPPAAAKGDPAPQPSQDNQPMNDVLRQLFNR